MALSKITNASLATGIDAGKTWVAAVEALIATERGKL